MVQSVRNGLSPPLLPSLSLLPSCSVMASPRAAVLQENVLWWGFTTIPLCVSAYSHVGVQGLQCFAMEHLHLLLLSLWPRCSLVSHSSCSYLLSPNSIFCLFLAMLPEAPPALLMGSDMAHSASTAELAGINCPQHTAAPYLFPQRPLRWSLSPSC